MTSRVDGAGPAHLEPARPPSRRSHRYAAWIARRRWWVVLSWGLLLTVLTVFAPPFGSGGDQIASIIPLDSPAIRAEVRSVEQFGFPLSSRTAVVQHDPEGLSPFTQAASVLEAVGVNQAAQPYPLLGALPLTNSLPLVPQSSERGTTVLTYLFMDPHSGFANQQEAARRYIAEHLSDPDDAVIGVTGSVPARAEQASIVARYLPLLEVLTVLAIVILLALNFRSVAAPLLALTASAVAFLVTLRLSGLLGTALGLAVPAELEPLLVALLLGIVTDYTIFYLSALRHRLRGARDWHDAVCDAVASFTPTVLVAGLTVAAGTGALLAAASPFFRTLGPALAMAVLVGLAVSVTLVPALMAILGPLVFWPRRIRPGMRLAPGTSGPEQADSVRGRSRGSAVELLTRRRIAVAVLLASVGMLVLAGLPLRSIHLGIGFTQSLPEGNPVLEASRAAAAGFAPGITSPTTLLIEGAGVAQDVPALTRLQDAVAHQPGVVGVIGPAQNITELPANVVLARNGDAARMLVILDTDPLSATAIQDIAHLKSVMPRLVEDSGLRDATISIAGDTALAEGLVSDTSADLWRIGLAALVVNLLLLVIFLRALVAPLYLLASSVLALAAAIGITVWVFQDPGDPQGLTFYVPFAAAVLLVSLGSDYNIFGVGHVWDAARSRPLREAIIYAVPQSTRAIGAAAITLAVSFGLLVIIPLRPFRELALAMSVGIMLDAVVVRSLLVPCMLTLVGPVSGWPGSSFSRHRTSTGTLPSGIGVRGET